MYAAAVFHSTSILVHRYICTYVDAVKICSPVITSKYKNLVRRNAIVFYMKRSNLVMSIKRITLAVKNSTTATYTPTCPRPVSLPPSPKLLPSQESCITIVT